MPRLLLIAGCVLTLAPNVSEAVGGMPGPAWTEVSLDGHAYGIPPNAGVFLPPPFGPRGMGGLASTEDLQSSVDANRQAAKADPSITHGGLFMSETVDGQPTVALFDLSRVRDSSEMRDAASEAERALYVDGVARLPGSDAKERSMFAVQTHVEVAPLALASCGSDVSGELHCHVTLDTVDGRRVRVLDVAVASIEPSSIQASVAGVVARVLPEAR